MLTYADVWCYWRDAAAGKQWVIYYSETAAGNALKYADVC
jgi:hypothetical protein